MRALRGFLTKPRNRIWGRFGFVDALCEPRNWYSRTYLAIKQGPIIAMIENHRTGLLWRLFMGAPEVRRGLARLGFTKPAPRHINVCSGATSCRRYGPTGLHLAPQGGFFPE
ncbi:glucoamylase family protein [Mesorhizobium sp. M1403]|uniref:glucoamylase family protein n=1 Tax=Mesorhizobium sp. M1403 TaxID=2957097 RepID=UPI00333C7DE1